MCQEGEKKKGFFAKMFSKMDKKMKEKADQRSCCSGSSCCPSDKPQNDGENKEGGGCC